MRGSQNIFDRVTWFAYKEKFEIDYFELLQPRRTVSEHSRYRSGLYYSKKCNRRIQYESALELHFIESLERNERVAFFWEQPVKIPYWRGRRKVNYTPDFGIYLRTGHFIVAEVKELSDMLDYRVERKTEALMQFCSERGFGLLLTNGTHTPKDLMKGKYNRKLERELLEALAKAPLRHDQCHAIMERCGATTAQLCKAVIRHNLRYKSFPVKLQHGTEESLFRQVCIAGENYDQLVKTRLEEQFHATPSSILSHEEYRSNRS